MAWSQLWINKPHLAYALIGGFTAIFSLISLLVKEKLFIGEATVATIFGIIIGPHALNWFAPITWGNSDHITIEVSRIVLVVQIFAVGVELPKKYMLKHWFSVFMLLVPVMTVGWLISSVFIWKLIPTLSWLEGLCIAACVTATDPVLASAVVGKSKFAERIPGHLRNLLSAESGCNDGLAFPFAYLALTIIQYRHKPTSVASHFILISVLYECVFGGVLGAVIGYCGRHLIKFAEKHNYIDRESFLVFYFVLALFCTGVGTIIGVDDLLVAFSAGAAFAWDGWFARKTEESHVSNVIDLLLNTAYFVYFGAIIPWAQYNRPDIGITPWRLVIIAILIILFRRIPIMLMVKPFVPDIRNWREALFCGHFGPIGVGAIFMCILTKAELEHHEPTPLAIMPEPGSPNYTIVSVIWPVVTFMVISSILVHGSSVAVFALGKRLNKISITMTYTTGGNSQSWLGRMPGLDVNGRSLSLHRIDTGEPFVFRQKSSSTAKSQAAGAHRRKGPRWNPDPFKTHFQRRTSPGVPLDETQNDKDEARKQDQVYREGPHLIVEDQDGEVLHDLKSKQGQPKGKSTSDLKLPDRITMPFKSNSQEPSGEPPTSSTRSDSSGDISPKTSPKTGNGDFPRVHDNEEDPISKKYKGQKLNAYQLDDNIIIEDEEGDVIRRYRVHRLDNGRKGSGVVSKISRYFKTLGHTNTGREADTSIDVEKSSGKPTNAPDFELVRVEADGKEHVSSLSDPMDNRLQAFLHSEQGVGARQSVALGTSGHRRHLSEDLAAGVAAPHDEPEADADIPRNFLGRRHDSDSDSDDEPPRNVEIDEETEAEKKRRLAALGIIDVSDEEDDTSELDNDQTQHSIPHGDSPNGNKVSWGGVLRR